MNFQHGKHRMNNNICSRCYAERNEKPNDTVWKMGYNNGDGLKRFCWSKFDTSENFDFYVESPPKECKYYLEQLMLERK